MRYKGVVIVKVTAWPGDTDDSCGATTEISTAESGVREAEKRHASQSRCGATNLHIDAILGQRSVNSTFRNAGRAREDTRPSACSAYSE